MKVKRLWFENKRIYILTEDEQELWQSLLWYPRLMNATEKQRAGYRITDSGIHWQEVDEDMSLESFLYDDPEPVGGCSDLS